MKEIGKDAVDEYVSDLQFLLDGFIAEFNDEQVRKGITNAIAQYVEDNYSNAVEYDVVCNDTNNTEETINKNMLMIDLVPKEKGITIRAILSPNGKFFEGTWDVTVKGE